MASSLDFVQYACDQIRGTGVIRYKKMFGEYMVYVNDKPILLICDDTVYVKPHDCIRDPMSNADRGAPYQGAKEHYILDIDDSARSREIVTLLEQVTPVPKPRKKKPRPS
jgi:TfoX/Sxy family transcriptional regulator of competence genes